jgi:signal transduction histidine kinase
VGGVRRWWPERVPFGLRVFFRGAFLLLALATVGLALSVLQEEKQLSYRNYQELFRKNVAQITARLQHPTGQLALLNPELSGQAQHALRPWVLPFAAIDFDDKAKAQQAVEMAGCLVPYPDQARLCVALGNQALAGGFVYAVGSLVTGPLQEHPVGEQDLSVAHRVSVNIQVRGQTLRWLAPLETAGLVQGKGLRGRLTGFAIGGDGQLAPRPDKEFRGWLWQEERCADARQTAVDCPRRAFFALRLPVAPWRDELFRNPRMPWPPQDLAQWQMRLAVLPPGAGPAVFDSQRQATAAPFALSELRSQLLVGERLSIRRGTGAQAVELLKLTAPEDTNVAPSPLLSRIIRQLPVEGYDQPLQARDVVSTPMGDFELLLTGDVRGLNRSLSVVASRLSWFVGAMLAAITLTWLAIELRIIRRITLLTRRAAAVKKSVHASEGFIQLDLQDLRGRDELGLLSGVLADLLARVNDDVRREQIRAQQEKDMWHAVGHEIMSPLQSLLALHPQPDDPSQRYIQRMQQAVRVLYGSASPSEAIESATLQLGTLDVQAFLQHVADNAVHAGIADVQFEGVQEPLVVKADEYSLEDVITHVLSNADRHRHSGTPIRITLSHTHEGAEVKLHNQGEPIDEAMLDAIFEYGVSDAVQTDGGAVPDNSHRGQGLFVARTYMAKMGGTIHAFNELGGVSFVMKLAAPPAG